MSSLLMVPQITPTQRKELRRVFDLVSDPHGRRVRVFLQGAGLCSGAKMRGNLMTVAAITSLLCGSIVGFIAASEEEG